MSRGQWVVYSRRSLCTSRDFVLLIREDILEIREDKLVVSAWPVVGKMGP